jgi:hypothetical protein
MTRPTEPFVWATRAIIHRPLTRAGCHQNSLKNRPRAMCINFTAAYLAMILGAKECKHHAANPDDHRKQVDKFQNAVTAIRLFFGSFLIKRAYPTLS